MSIYLGESLGNSVLSHTNGISNVIFPQSVWGFTRRVEPREALTAICYVFLILHKQIMHNSSSWMTTVMLRLGIMRPNSNLYCRAFTGRIEGLSHPLETLIFRIVL